MGATKHEKKVRKALAKGLKKALKARAKSGQESIPVGEQLPHARNDRVPSSLGAPSNPPEQRRGSRPGVPEAEAREAGKGRYWVGLVAALAFPSVLFVLLRQLAVAHGYFGSPVPDLLDVSLLWVLGLTRELSAVVTFLAFAAALMGTCLRRARAEEKMILWLLVALAVMACLYISQVPY
jgi:hypothetical protein